METAGHELVDNSLCSIARTLEVVGDKWTLLVLREAALGEEVTRFADFRSRLGIATDVLAGRLGALVEAGIMEKRPYQESGSRTRFGYHLTTAGEQLRLILGALQQWGDDNRPPDVGPTVARRSADQDRPVRVAFVDDTDAVVRLADVRFTPTAAYPSGA
ncbi:helix-turn-helix domain-containing protein [Actinoallomurus bryophytorum]|uniref:HxlR family transcriptional regulator n=1 Tax=Actinoallomurus bryophytorum TaxID=1490222 RepID=A0A543BTM9_9ACTN|nr:helix-turn-helix domain-containing protein [Actinoallomurus bryophytorum]TQL88182.1 HxlR family transcriptional regulator [Actinoallomurus bryophytorum]